MGNVLKTLLITANECDYLEENTLSKIGGHISFIKKSGIENVIFHVNILNAIGDEKRNRLTLFLKTEIDKTFGKTATIVDNYTDIEKTGTADASVYFVLGLGGRSELKTILSKMIRESQNQNQALDAEKMTADEVQKFISGNLILPMEPDLVLSCHEETLTDFMIWQTIYSEYVFIKKSLNDLTTADLEKAFTDFKNRQRRYGV
ncbi:Ditrans,polycis-undecaprenyl-diphosphate synthase ((2E,6E)-farnesyl-diphosphate specific) [Methanosarcinaceae archaeon Ag5]|uniref:Ditrans,polycis-undecaprenyl-diphosphate synthase ((2E,6E)-farnesyl-diphosphate specific) n=1 Tax=Methanolapillus africanus TaxID=3028297 RepID=A0AAE4MMN1_9EURY|nr:Ditrans,polycis-undecaprenyl-diphosphate synthase ((2E,6E)-farnesyl-diphosphate specific) [Methanosarcinaceae archaeon Ag5]